VSFATGRVDVTLTRELLLPSSAPRARGYEPPVFSRRFLLRRTISIMVEPLRKKKVRRAPPLQGPRRFRVGRPQSAIPHILPLPFQVTGLAGNSADCPGVRR